MILVSSYWVYPRYLLEDNGTRSVFKNLAYQVVFNTAFTQLGENFFYGQEVVTVGRTRFWIHGGYANRELFGDI